MILKKVKIYNYRQLQKVELDLQNSLTVLAGPNNSGKTTLISVLKGMFRDKKLSFTYSDIPTNLSTSWVEKIIPVFQSIMVENDKNTGISEIIKKISVDDKLLPEYTIECFHAEIQVDYDPTGDDIQLFADYLMDLDESKHSFYFIYSYEPSIASFEKYLGECYDKMSSRFLDIRYYYGDTQLDGQSGKKYDNKGAAQRYIQGRADFYAHLFTELSPPIPKSGKRLFSVNGHLLPNYRMEQTQPDQNVLDDLMSYLTIDDLVGKEQPAKADGPLPKEPVSKTLTGPSDVPKTKSIRSADKNKKQGHSR